MSDAMSAALARNWWAVALRGVSAVVFGLIALFLPGVTLAALVLLFAAYMMVDGVFATLSALRAARQHERWGFLVLGSIADFAAGAIVLTWWMSAYALFFGVALLVLAFRLRRARREMSWSGAVPHGI